MGQPGSTDRPLRVAVVGSGPAGFYVVQHLLQTAGLHVEIDLYDRLITPFGLVRYGVAPDHAKIKTVTQVYDKLARDPRVQFFGGVEFGSDVTLGDFTDHYDQAVFATGAQTDRNLGIPGEELEGSHAATEFVAWFNAHPDFADARFDLDVEQAVVVGVGNVAVDVARILCRSTDELARTDIADVALAALEKSRIRTVHVLGRRGPVQAAFTTPEVKELGELAGTTTLTLADEIELDPLSRAELERADDKSLRRRIEILGSLAARDTAHSPAEARRLILRFLVSPIEILGDDRGRVRGVRIVRNTLVDDGRGHVVARATEREEILPCGLVFRSVGYRGVPLRDLPFDERRGIVPSVAGRIVGGDGATCPGLYVAGWIKRGPSGVIGTNKPDAAETVQSMLADLAASPLLRPQSPARSAIVGLLARRGVRRVDYADWLRLDGLEVAKGAPQSRPRVKFPCREAMYQALSG